MKKIDRSYVAVIANKENQREPLSRSKSKALLGLSIVDQKQPLPSHWKSRQRL